MNYHDGLRSSNLPTSFHLTQPWELSASPLHSSFAQECTALGPYRQLLETDIKVTKQFCHYFRPTFAYCITPRFSASGTKAREPSTKTLGSPGWIFSVHIRRAPQTQHSKVSTIARVSFWTTKTGDPQILRPAGKCRVMRHLGRETSGKIWEEKRLFINTINTELPDQTLGFTGETPCCYLFCILSSSWFTTGYWLPHVRRISGGPFRVNGVWMKCEYTNWVSYVSLPNGAGRPSDHQVYFHIFDKVFWHIKNALSIHGVHLKMIIRVSKF